MPQEYPLSCAAEDIDHDYIPLLSLFAEDLSKVDHPRSPLLYNRLTVLAVVAGVLCTCLNIFAYASTSRAQVRHFMDIVHLRRPSQFFGIDRVTRPPHESPALVIYPNMLQVINRSEPRTAYSDDPVRFAQSGTLVAPEDRLFKVTSEVSTIVEFRTVDYHMEQCEIAVFLPEHITQTLEYPHIQLGDAPILMDIWKLRTTYPIDPKLLTWSTRPSRVGNKVDTVAVAPGLNYTYRFQCPSDSLQVFEFSAATPTTSVEWSQDHDSPIAAVVLVQHSSAGTSQHTREEF
ncbi:hypothetical protein BV25DRAFT_961190 [Artomyces pyxidatus]|uniref:Uncharacterized protein n=1 Tax=Artomyces pyxidatus TaxID=48021 RepID=A0ACB8SVZ3_9AGAM|nr:hypothetical protein BV25DRAFT_961190 [Artomyces pyxidatus]